MRARAESRGDSGRRSSADDGTETLRAPSIGGLRDARRRCRSGKRRGTWSADDGESGEGRTREQRGSEERVLIAAGADKDARADHRTEDTGKTPREKQNPVVGRQILCAVEIASQRRVDRELRAVAV